MRIPSPSSALAQLVNHRWHWRALASVSLLLLSVSPFADAQEQKPVPKPSKQPAKQDQPSAPGGGTSNAQTFTINNPVPTLTSISPTKGNVG